MTEYIIYKKEPCDIEHKTQDNRPLTHKEAFCTGYKYTEVNLLDVLAKVRWGDPVGDPARGIERVHEFGNVRIEE